MRIMAVRSGLSLIDDWLLVVSYPCEWSQTNLRRLMRHVSEMSQIFGRKQLR